MRDWRIATGINLICLPALCATAFSVLAYFRLRPVYEEQERVRLTAQYREVAEDLRDHPEKGTEGVLPSPRGRVRSMGKGRWGYVEKPTGVTVWYIVSGRPQVVTIAPTDTVSPLAFVLPIGIFSLFLFWAVTIAGCWLFARSVRERDDFVAATAHDLTTPLVALRRLIGRDDDEARLVTERLVRIVRNLTDYLKLRGRTPRPNFETFDIREAYDEAYGLFAEDFRWVLNGRDVPVAGETPLRVSADRLLTVQIIWNLLANELKYAAPHGPVSVRFEADADSVRVVFADEGPGLSAYGRRRVFDRYYRAMSVKRSGKGGFGIGLCTAREYARSMGGDVTVAANRPKGCVFTLSVRRSR